MTPAAHPAPPVRDRAALVRRNTLLLALAQAALLVVTQGILTVGTVAAVDLTGREGAGGLLFAIALGSAAVGAPVFGAMMDRRGRRPGLLAGYGLLALGSLTSALAARIGAAPALLAAAVPLGLGMGAAQLGRGAVADMHPVEERGRAVGLLLLAGVFGAVAGPFLVPASRALAEGRGADPDVAPWLLLAAAATVGGGLVAALRPDPRDLAADGPQALAGPRRPPSRLLRVPSFRVALLVTAVSQMSMVGIMGVTPVVIHRHGGGALLVSTAISGHLVGMYAFSPAFGWLVDRAGRRAGLALGGGVSAAGALLAAALQGGPLLGVALFLVGLGWSAAYVSVTAVISDVTEPQERAAALGLADLLASVASTAAALLGGLALEAVGFTPLALGMTALLLPTVAVAVQVREARVGVPADLG
ncbi:MAG TPA: MFS transporter [Actinomycetota bacterium]|nr:MFS transporter [Actinomycetota bacterium]